MDASTTACADAQQARAEQQGWDPTAEAIGRLIEEHLPGPRQGPGRPPFATESRPAAAPAAAPATADSTRHLIVGGGPAGLSAGLHLEDADFLLADKQDRPGGLCRSIVEDGFTFDYAGHIFFTNDPYVDRLFRESWRTTSTSSCARAGSTSTAATSAIRSRATCTGCRRP